MEELTLKDGDSNLNNITIGAGISNRLGLGKSDSVLIVSPLDINFSSMNQYKFCVMISQPNITKYSL